jgi:anti-sigma factor RsiW
VIKLLAFFRRDAHADIDTLSAAVDGSLDRARAAALEAHLASCEACSRRIEELRAVRSTLRAMPSAEAPRSFRLRQSDAEATARRPANSGAASVLRLMPAMSAVAVVLFAVLVGVDVLSGRDGSSGLSGNSSAAPAALEQRAKGTLAGASAPQTAAADQAPGAQVPAPGGEVPGVEPAQTATGGTVPAPPTSDSATTLYARAAPTRPTSAAFRDTSAGGGKGGNHRGLRVAEAIVAAVAIGAGAAAVFAWRRSRGVRR